MAQAAPGLTMQRDMDQADKAPLRPRRARMLVLALLWLGLVIFGLQQAFTPLSVQRLSDLDRLRDALAAYQRDHGRYPPSPGVSIGDASRPPVDAWIPGLTPRYLKQQPRDPRHLPQPSRQYLYLSDGKDYELIAHGAEDAPAVTRDHPAMADPRRPGYAYGYWTPGAQSW